MDIRATPRQARRMEGPPPQDDAVHSATPDTDPGAFWKAAEQTAIIGIFIMMLGGVLIYTRPIAVPIVSAIVIGSMVGFLVERLTKRGVPSFVAISLIVVLLSMAVYGLIAAFSTPLSSWIGRAPEIGTILSERFRVLQEPMQAMQAIQKSLSSLTGDSESSIVVDTKSSIIESVLTVATPALSQFFVFVGTLLFFLAGRQRLKRNLVIAFVSRDARLMVLRILTEIERSLGQYLATVTLINIGLGIATGCAMWLIDLPNPALWGLLAFTMNYIPFIGAAIVALILFGVGVVTFATFTASLVPAAIFLCLNFIESQFVTPSVVGRRMTINPFLVFLALAFWAWIWGPVGAFLAVPLLVVAIVIFDHVFPREQVELPG